MMSARRIGAATPHEGAIPRGARRDAHQRGMAVITALLVVAAAATIAAAMLDGQTARTRRLESEKARVQARWLLLGGVDWAREILRADARRSPVTHAAQLWATPIADLRIGQDDRSDAALFSGRIEDEESKYNLDNLAVDGRVDPRQLVVFERLLQALNLRATAAPDIARRIAAAQPLADGGDAAADTGATQGATQRAPARHPPRAPGLESLDDLQGIAGVDDEAIRRLRCCVTVLPDRTPVNVNTAPPEVLYAVIEQLPLGQAVALVAERDRGRYFNDAADFVNRVANPEIRVDQKTISTNSTWFGLAGSVRLGRATVAMRALLQRDDDQSTSIVWMREVN